MRSRVKNGAYELVYVTKKGYNMLLKDNEFLKCTVRGNTNEGCEAQT